VGLLANLFRRRRLPSKMGYQDAREALESRNREVKRELAAREDAPPETLYYLACDDDSEVRQCVAANPATPIHADELLQTDTDDDVRVELARKFGRLLPDMDDAERLNLRERVLRLIERLAADEVPRVRAMLAEEVKSCPLIPKRLALQLARDTEIAVAAPILQYSPLLSDEDLVELIATARVEGAIEAMAKRAHVSPAVSEAVIATLDIAAIGQLLANDNAQIREDTLQQVIAQAADIQSWHKPLAMRPGLSLRAMKRISSFVSRSLLETLANRHGLDDETRDLLKSRLQSRLEGPAKEEAPAGPLAAIKRAHEEGRLGDDEVMEAATLQQRDGVALALSCLSGAPLERVDAVLKSKSGRAVTALCWRAGLSMRTALEVERHIALVEKAHLLLPRAGTDFPLDEEEMRWHLDYFDIEA